jgi:hypothetical protein
MGTSKNIIIGAARLFLGPSVNSVAGADITAKITTWRPAVTGTARYTDVLTQTPQVTAGWFDVGYTQDGIEVATDPSWTDVEVDQLLDAAKIFQDGMGLTISTTFAEATLENLLIAWGQQSSFVTSTATDKEINIEGGSLGAAPLERGLIAVGNAPEKSASNAYGERTYFAYRVLSVDASTHTLARAEATTIPVSFRALPADNGRYGAVRDRLNVV